MAPPAPAAVPNAEMMDWQEGPWEQELLQTLLDPAPPPGESPLAPLQLDEPLELGDASFIELVGVGRRSLERARAADTATPALRAG